MSYANISVCDLHEAHTWSQKVLDHINLKFTFYFYAQLLIRIKQTLYYYFKNFVFYCSVQISFYLTTISNLVIIIFFHSIMHSLQ